MTDEIKREKKPGGRGRKSPIPAVERSRIAAKKYYGTHADTIRATSSKYYLEHKEEVLQKAMARYDAKCAFKRLMKEAQLRSENDRNGLTPDDGRADLEPLGVTGAQLAEQFAALNIDVQIQEAPRSVEDVDFLEREHQAICAYGREHGYH
jgi:hypothetical protein